MKLSEKQVEFTKCVAKLINYANSRGYDLTFGDAFRDSRVHGQFGEKRAYGNKNSVHKLRLAVDFNLFIGGQYVPDGNHKAYQDIGIYWESLNNNARWGGRFNDANHFSFEHWGVM